MRISFRALAAVAVFTQLGLGACVNTEREVATSTVDPRSKFTPPTGKGERVGGATVLNTVRTTHPFSNPKLADVFVLQMRGPRILTSRVHFIVLSSQGDTLRHEVLPARVLLADPDLRDNQSASVRDKEISILRGMNAFFSPDHFVMPAVAAGTPQPPEADARAWASLRLDPTAVGFDYPSPTGAPKRLTYSHQLNKVLVLSE